MDVSKRLLQVAPRGSFWEKYRIVPVGWQLAAEYIRDFSGGDFNLGFLVMASEMCDEDNYSPYCGLVRPDWVLKSTDKFL